MSTPTGAFKYIHTHINKHKHTCLGMKRRPKHTHISFSKLIPSTYTSAKYHTNTAPTQTHPHRHMELKLTRDTSEHPHYGHNHFLGPKRIKHTERCTKGKQSSYHHAHRHISCPPCAYAAFPHHSHTQMSCRAWLCCPQHSLAVGGGGSSIPSPMSFLMIRAEREGSLSDLGT